MANKDYVKRGRSPKPANKKSSPNKKKAPAPSRFPIKWAVGAIVLVFGLITSLFFLSGTDVPEKPKPKDELPTIIKPQPANDVKKAEDKEVLPPKPEEKWRYIQELENKKVIVPDELKNQRVQPVKKETVHKKHAEKKPAAKKPVEKKPTAKKPVEKKPTAQKPVEKIPAAKKPVEKKPAAKKPVEKKPAASNERFVLQCGSYRKKSQADARKAKIAFQGMNSQIKISNDAKGAWYRVVLGPYSQKSSAEKDKAKLQSNGVSPCGIWHWK